MKDFKAQQNKRQLQSIDEDQFCLSGRKLQQNKNSNADIDYLLSFVSHGEGQQLRLMQNNIRKPQQQQNLQRQNIFLDNQSITKYVVENSSKESESVEERSNLILFIDLGLRVINKVKKLMSMKKQQLKNSAKLSSNKQFSLIKDLFFPQNNNNSGSKSKQQQYQSLKQSNNDTKSQTQQMRHFILQRQKDMLLHKLPINNVIADNNGDKYKYMLTASLYEGLIDKKDGQKANECNVLKLIDRLEVMLAKLQGFSDNQSQNQQRSQQEVMINQIWILIEQISTALKSNINNST